MENFLELEGLLKYTTEDADSSATHKCAKAKASIILSIDKSIVNTMLDKCSSMESYVSDIISTAQKLSDVGFEVSDEWLAIFLLAGLNDEYSPMIMAMESSGKTLQRHS